MAKQRFFSDDGFEFLALIVLGSAPYRLAETGEVFATCDRITDGDADSWFNEWMATAEQARSSAERAESAGHLSSARDAYLRAANYAGAAFFYVLATNDPTRELATWRRHRDSFDRAMNLWATPMEPIEIPYEDTALHGYFWSGGDGARPTIILNNGSDGPVSDMLVMGAVDAIERGYNAITFDGPGQGYALYEQKMFFRHDWEKVITPVVDYLFTRQDVDHKRIALSGNSQGGYWAPRAAAFEKRLAAVVADPGVIDVGASWSAHFPPEMMQLIDSNQDDTFNEYFAQGLKEVPEIQLTLTKRMEPYGLASMAAIMRELRSWNLTDVAHQITTPIFITNPDDEQFWPGQSQRLFDLVSSEKKALVAFTRDEGANWHCEPMAPQIRAQRMFDWLDDVLNVNDS